MWASTPTNILQIRIGAFVFAGACRRADRVVRPYKMQGKNEKTGGAFPSRFSS